MKLLIKLVAVLLFLLPNIALAQGTGQLAAGQIWGNPSAAKAPATATTIGAILDRSYSCTGRGDIMMRGASLWGCFVPGTSGLPLVSAGAGADLTWARLPLASLALGTSDTIIGYFGATTGSALAIGNCANSLTYSTSTHTFGCNTSAGTGTVTSLTIAAGTGISVSGTCTITSIGTCTIAASSTPTAGPYITNATLTSGSGGVASGRSYTGVSISTAAGNRYVIVTNGFRSGPSCPLASMTIGGVAASRVAQNIVSITNTTITSIWIANVPTGTTATIATTYCGSVDSAEALGVYVVYGLTTGFVDSGSSSSATVPKMTIAVPASGYIISAAWALGQTSSITQLTLLPDFALLSDPTSTSQYFYGASAVNTPVSQILNVGSIYGSSCGASECSALVASFK